MATTFGIYGRHSNNVPHVMIHETEQLQPEARLAAMLVERWGMVACEFAGEDTSGRQQLRRLTSVELATEACDAAQRLYEEFRVRGWTIAVPSISEMEKMMEGRDG